MLNGSHSEPLNSALDPLSAGIFEASQDCVKLIDLEGRLLAMNVNGLCLMEIDDFEPMKGRLWATFWPTESRPVVTAAVAQAAAGAVARFCAECPTATGLLKAWEVVVSPICDAAGRTVQVVAISQDVTERRQALERTALMSLELAHRIKNVFAVMDGVIALSARAEPQAAVFADTLRKRLHALGRATSFVSPADAGGSALPTIATLHGLLQTLLEPYGAIEGPSPQLLIAGHDCAIGRSATTALALVINELATNAIKYGALKSSHGRVELRISAVGQDIELVWRELGENTVQAEASDLGFGTSLLDNAVIRLLKGHLKRQWRSDGLRISIQIPAANLIL